MEPNRITSPIRFCLAAVLPAAALLFTLVALSACHKEADILPTARAENPISAQTLNPRSSADEQAVLAYAQWVLDHLVPLAENEAALADIQAGNYSSDAVMAYVQSRGFANFESLAQAHADRLQPIKAGALSADIIAGILGDNLGSLNFATSLGGMMSDANLPCYQQFVTDLTFAASAALLAAETVVGAVATGIVGVAAAYYNFKNCLRANYPNGG